LKPGFVRIDGTQIFHCRWRKHSRNRPPRKRQGQRIRRLPIPP
jgi:hypothetical protein